MPDLPRNLAKPTLALVPRVVDQLSFLYLDLVRVIRDDNGVAAVVSRDGEDLHIYLPTASTAAVLLGPGTSITQPAARQLCHDGCTIVLTGAAGVRCYGYISPDTLTTDWLHRQATAWADPLQREEVARRLYAMRFGNKKLIEGKSIAQLRGLEGARVKRVYQQLARQHGVSFRRSYRPDDFEASDPINQALTAANSALYGIVHACIAALGCSPALGFIHTGTQRSFVYDLADLYKLEITVPLAFAMNSEIRPDKTIRWRFRNELRLLRLTRRVVNNLQAALDPTVADFMTKDTSSDVLHLWDPDAGELPAGHNYEEI